MDKSLKEEIIAPETIETISIGSPSPNEQITNEGTTKTEPALPKSRESPKSENIEVKEDSKEKKEEKEEEKEEIGATNKEGLSKLEISRLKREEERRKMRIEMERRKAEAKQRQMSQEDEFIVIVPPTKNTKKVPTWKVPPCLLRHFLLHSSSLPCLLLLLPL